MVTRNVKVNERFNQELLDVILETAIKVWTKKFAQFFPKAKLTKSYTRMYNYWDGKLALTKVY